MNKFIVFTLLLASISLFGQNKEALQASALRDAKITSEATIAKEFKTVVKHTYPSVVEFMGGPDATVEAITGMFSQMESEGFKFEKADVQFVSDVVFEQNEYRCYVQTLNQMRMPKMQITSKSYLLGVYDDEKDIWYFIEASKMKDANLMSQLFPGFETTLKIPDDETTTKAIED